MPGGKLPGAGRPKGSKNQRTLDGERYARAILENPIVIAKFLEQAQQGLLPPDLVKTLLTYAYGKPYEVPLDGDSDSPRTITLQF